MSERRWIARFVAALAAIVGVTSAEPAAAQPNYTYTVIADVSGCFNVGGAVLGNNGEVAFAANCAGFYRVKRGDGIVLTDIYVFNPGVSQYLNRHLGYLNQRCGHCGIRRAT